MAGTISVGKAQAKGPYPAFPSCPVAFCHLREAGEYWLWLQGSWVSAVPLWSYEQNQGQDLTMGTGT